MSIIYNGKSVAGKYNISSVTNASDISAGIIKIATEDELLDSFNNETAITPHLLNEVSKKNSFNNSRITNCVTEIPQDIKLELNNGVLTVKAGSKVYVPNGKNADGSNKFDEVIVGNDLIINWNLNRAGDIVAYNPTTGALAINTATYSGSVAPTSGIFYNTETNLVYDIYTNHNVSGYSLPLCKFSSSSTGITNVDQTFNGFGYIGSIVYALPNIKGLIPNGRNADGTLKNIELTATRVVTRNITWDCKRGQKVALRLNDGGLDSTSQVDFYYQQEQEPNIATHAYWYKPSVNKLYRRSSTESWYVFNAVVIGEWYNTGANTNISDFNTIQSFRVVDYNEFNATPHIIETYQSGTSGYIVYSNGYCEQWGIVSFTAGDFTDNGGTVTYLKGFKDTNYNGLASINNRPGFTKTVGMFSGAKTATSFSWGLDNEGGTSADGTFTWKVWGYIR